jgi:hypothetical protein
MRRRNMRTKKEPIKVKKESIENKGNLTKTKKEAEVSIVLGSTLNMGNFESLKVQVGMSYPCKAGNKEIRKTFKYIAELTEELLKEEINKLAGR